MKFLIKNSLTTIFTFVIMLSSSLSAQVIYVDVDASGTNDGSSWTNAYTSLQTALGVATSTDEIWIAEGEYFPTSGTNRSTSFQLSSGQNGLKIYGGFVGGETILEQRSPEVQLSILSGDIGVAHTNSDNSYTILTTESGISRSTIIDGLVFTKANNTSPSSSYGAIENYGSPTIQNCIFRNNEGSHGASMFNYSSAFPHLINCDFINNVGTDDAGGIYNYRNFKSGFDAYSNNTIGFILEDCYFENNICSGNGTDFGGAAVFNDNASGLIKKTQFKSNDSDGANSYGGAILNLSRSGGTKKFDIVIDDCLFETNSAQVDGGAIQNTKKSGGISGTLTILNCTFDNNTPNDIGNDGTNITIQPSANVVPDRTKDLLVTSPTICANSHTSIELANSENGVDYELRDDSNNSIVGTAISGNGGNISFPTDILTENKSYSIWAKDTASGNIVRLDETASVEVNALPTPSLNSGIVDNVICEGETLTFTAGGGVNYDFVVDGNTVQSGASDTYTFDNIIDGQDIYVIVQNSNGCSSESEIITIHHKEKLVPTISISGAKTITCSNETVSYQVSMEEDWLSSYTFEWTLDGNIIPDENTANLTLSSIPNGGELSVKALPLVGCYDETTTALSITVTELAPMPDELIIEHNFASNTIYEGDFVKFYLIDTDGIEGLTFQWYLNNIPVEGADSVSFETNKLKEGDEVHLEVVQTSSCSEANLRNSQESNTLVLSIQTVLERELPIQVVIYPNPTSDIAYITPKNEEDRFDEVLIHVYDMQGQLLIQTDNINTNETVAIDLSSLSPNVYQMLIFADNRKIMKKVIVQ